MINYIHFPPYAEYLIISNITGERKYLIAQDVELSDTEISFYDENKNLITKYKDGEITFKRIRIEPHANCKIETEPYKFGPFNIESHIYVSISDMNNLESRWYLGGK